MLQTLRKINFKFDIIILMSILAVSIIDRVHTDMILYNAGLVNGPEFKVISYGLLYELLKVVIVLFAIIRIFFNLSPGRRNKKYVATALFSFLIYIGSCVFVFTLHKPGSVYYLRGFKEWATRNVDIDAVQVWILSKEADEYIGHRYEQGNVPSDLPDFIKNVNPFWIDCYESENGRFIELLWPHAFSEYKGIAVGSPAIKTEQEELIKHSNYNFQYRHSIKPGVYVVLGR